MKIIYSCSNIWKSYFSRKKINFLLLLQRGTPGKYPDSPCVAGESSAKHHGCHQPDHFLVDDEHDVPHVGSAIAKWDGTAVQGAWANCAKRIGFVL